MPGYAELAVTSNFSFLRGASHPEEFVRRAQELGLAGIGIADRNSVAGLVRAHSVAKETGLRFASGARLVLADGTPDILAFPSDRAAWSRLTRLLSVGKRRAKKGDCTLALADLLEWDEGLNLIVLPPARINREALQAVLARLKKSAAKRLWLGARMAYAGDDERRLMRLAILAQETHIPLLAVNDAHYHVPERRMLQDVLTCVREHTTIDKAGRKLAANAERHLKAPDEMARLFRKTPAAVAETLRFLDACRFSLDELGPDYPDETRHGYASAQEALAAFVEEGARTRYPAGVPEKIRCAIAYELKLVAELAYAPYFLTVHDIVRFARAHGILAQGRGSAANSTLCYCLGITEVDPLRSDLLFERFVSAERNEPPDIDVDFEHERREEVIQYIYNKYGRARAGMTATTICYRGRSAIRDVGKAFGLSDDVVGTLARTLWGWSSEGVAREDAAEKGLDSEESQLKRVLALAQEMIDFPRHLSQHMGGFVITRGRLDETVPIENAVMEERTVIEWNKDDLDALGILKVDILGLGMLSCLRRAYDLMAAHYGRRFITATLPAEDEAVYRMLSRADSVGVFQVESRAQMSMLPRLKPKTFYDLVIEVAIVRPGPIQGDMVHPYLRRRQGLERVHFPAPAPKHGKKDELEQVLKKTLGVPLFQEQAMRIAIVAAKFTPAEADRLRRAMATFRRVGTITSFRDRFVANMCGRGYLRDFAQSCFKQIEGFGEYGFPESHAASFALLVYASAWIKCHYPDAFACALLNSQPMGFYAPPQIVRDAAEHGITIRPVDVNHSYWDNILESDGAVQARLAARHADMRGDLRATHAIRLGFRQIAGFAEADAKRIAEARDAGFASIRDLWLRTGLQPAVLRRLAQADAFTTLSLSRREALWAVRALRRTGDKDDLPLLARAALPSREPETALPDMRLSEQVVEDYRHLRLSLRAHPVSFVRDDLDRRGVTRLAALARLRDGAPVTVAGLVTTRQRPGSATSVFMTLEDESAIANVIVWERVFARFKPVVMGAKFVQVSGRLQKEEGVLHVLAERLSDMTATLARLADATPTLHAGAKDVANVEATLPKGRNFH